MPQLILSPWFSIFLLSWFTLILILKPKITQLTYESLPKKTDEHTQKTYNWTWPWP